MGLLFNIAISQRSVHSASAVVQSIPQRGPGGAGKTFLYAALLHYVHGKVERALACAWSGIAAVLLQGGRTCHSRFGFTVPLADQSIITAQQYRAEDLRRGSLIL